MTLGWENPAQPVVSINLFDCVAYISRWSQLGGHYRHVLINCYAK